MGISKISSNAEYRIDKKFQNLLIFWISILFQIEKILKICFNFSRFKILEICWFYNLENS